MTTDDKTAGDAARDQAVMATLAPPGAGLPWLHLAFNRLVMRPFVEGPTSWAEAKAAFTRRDAQVRTALAGLTTAQLEQRVLVPRLLGLEDSSRYWSVAMTCRHLEVVGSLIADVVVRLSRGEHIGERVDFAAVKPVDVPATAVDEYARYADGVLARIEAGVVDRAAKGTVPHPWFGEFDQKGWLWLLGLHTWVHARQVRAIRQGLRQ